MKADSGIRGHQSLSLWRVIVVLCCLTFAAMPLELHADGFFVHKFVWDKQKDINEPSQKAIIVHDAGHEDLILQVKYDGPLDEFGWLIPVPNLPTVKKGSMECFYELSKFSQKNLEPKTGLKALAMSSRGYGSAEEEPPVKVIEIKTVGAYETAVLSTKDSTALENWLATNQFAFPTNASEVIDSYVKQGWYFVAVKINLQRGSLYATSKELASGELNPLQLSFASERCVFPLKISSLNRTASEVQVYVLSPEPLVEKRLFEQDLSGNYQWRTNMLAKRAALRAHLEELRASMAAHSGRTVAPILPTYPEEGTRLSSRSEINTTKLVPYAPVAQNDLPVCSRSIPLLSKGKNWWLMKQTWTFQPEEMRDLDFEPALPVFSKDLAEDEGAFAAANLILLGTNGASALITAFQNTNPVVRAHAMSVAENMFTIVPTKPNPSEDEEPERQVINPDLLKLLPILLSDPDPEVRLHAANAVENSRSPIFFDRMLELLRDDYPEISQAAQYYFHDPKEAPKHMLLFRQMLKDTNANVQIAGFRALISIPNVQIPREELLALFSVPRMEVAGAAASYLRAAAGPGGQGISCEEAKPLLHNSLAMIRMIGLATIVKNANSQTVELTIPLLRDPEEVIRVRAYDSLTDLTGQNFPADHPEQWENWWEQNKATFSVTISPVELRQKQMERLRQRRATANPLPQ